MYRLCIAIVSCEIVLAGGCCPIPQKDQLNVQILQGSSNIEKKELPKNITTGLGMKFVWIAPGSFMMGSPDDEKERQADETLHKVTLTKGYYMGAHTITQEHWEKIMGSNPSNFKGDMRLPVENISWEDCQEFIEKLRKKDNRPYRLPTEAEWEYACRAGATTPFHTGETISTDQANYDGEGVYGTGKKGPKRKKTTPVGSFPANAWGLHDMHGNVAQWCQDLHGEYPSGEVVDPQGPDTGKYRVQRGGSWATVPRFCRSAYRDGDGPDFFRDSYGLRLCFFPD